MHYAPLHVSSRLAAHHQEDRLCINSNWYSQNTTYDCTNCSLLSVDPTDDEQQVCSKYVEAYY
jgi:hypothetical protein